MNVLYQVLLLLNSKANPFNFTVEVDYKYAKFFNSGEVFTFGDSPVDLSDIKIDETINEEVSNNE